LQHAVIKADSKV